MNNLVFLAYHKPVQLRYVQAVACGIDCKLAAFRKSLVALASTRWQQLLDDGPGEPVKDSVLPTMADNTVNLNGTLYAVSNNEGRKAILFQFVTNGVLLNAIGVLGVFGNVISMIILSRPQMKSSINYLLIGLARCDTVLIITSVLLFGLPAIFAYTGFLFTYYFKVYPHIAPYVFPLALIAQTVSVYLTLTVTLERFVAVCHPLQARSLCTYGRARVYVLVIIVFSTLYNLPRFWDVRVSELGFDERHNTTLYFVEPSGMRSNPYYVKIYVHWLYLVFMYFLPFSCLALFNTAIYRQVRKANKERQRLSRLQKKEIGLATMLLCVVFVFFLCNILALVNNVLEAFYGDTVDQLVKTSDLLITINSSVNFIIYVTFGEKFKRLFFKLFCSHGLFGIGGRDSPEGGTHDDSVVSNGDGRNCSLRSTHVCHLNRTGTSVLRNGSMSLGGQRSVRKHRAPSPGPYVHYPSRGDWDAADQKPSVITTCLDQL